VHAGQLLAHDRRGELRAERDGILFMPLYQPLGDDGFFFGREESGD
jgi:succinylglutamate desuccinylase